MRDPINARRSVRRGLRLYEMDHTWRVRRRPPPIVGDYDQGYRDGLVDGALIAQPINTGGHTFEEYQRVRDNYTRAIAGPVSDYARGYADGLDAIAVAKGYAEPTEEQIAAFYDTL